MVQHTTFGLHTLDAYVTTMGFLNADKVLLRITPYIVTLPFVSMEGKSRYVGFIRMDASHFNSNPKYDD